MPLQTEPGGARQLPWWHLLRWLQVTLMGHDLVLWKEPGAQGSWSCLDNACPHR
jgi:hypothetical protein